MLLISLRSVRHVRSSCGRPSPWIRALACDSISASKPVTNTSPSQEAMDIIRRSQAFCFDVDSTVIAEEGIDQLAAFKGVGQQVADLTKK